MSNVQNVILDHVVIDSATDMGINGTIVTTFSMFDSTFRHAGNMAGEGGIYIRELLGPYGFSGDNHIFNSTIEGSHDFNVRIVNTTATGSEPDFLSVEDSTIQNVTSNTGVGLQAAAQGNANLRLSVSGSNFVDNGAVGAQMDADTNAVGDLRLQTSTFNATQPGGTNQKSALKLFAAGSSTIYFNVHDNATIVCEDKILHFDGRDLATLNGFVRRNTIEPATDNNSTAIVFETCNSAAGVVKLDGNSIQKPTGEIDDRPIGMVLAASDGTASLDATVVNNSIDSHAANFGTHGMYFDSGSGSQGESPRLCADIAGNAINVPVGATMLTQYSGTTFQIQGLTPPAGATAEQVHDYVTALNSGVQTQVVTYNGCIVNYTAADCQTPSVPVLPTVNTSAFGVDAEVLEPFAQPPRAELPAAVEKEETALIVDVPESGDAAQISNSPWTSHLARRSRLISANCPHLSW